MQRGVIVDLPVKTGLGKTSHTIPDHFHIKINIYIRTSVNILRYFRLVMQLEKSMESYEN